MISRSCSASIAISPGFGPRVNETRTYRKPQGIAYPAWNTPTGTRLTTMSKTTKALKKQAAKSQLVAQRSASPVVAAQMTSLAAAFRAQAAVLKKKNNKKK